MALPVVAFAGVSKSFCLNKKERITALQDFTLEVAQGELLAVTGPSGSGKTTALRLIAGLEKPNAGKILLGEMDAASIPSHHRHVAMVFQSLALYPHLTAAENLAFGLRIEKMAPDEIDRRIHTASELLKIPHLLQKLPDTLSGGERQRVALARAIVAQPKILLLDEPFSNLDAPLRLEMRDELERLHRTLALTTVLVTHDQSDALAIAGRIAVLRNGHLEQIDQPQQIYRKPANRFVAGFFGEMNFLHGIAAADGTLRIAGQAFPTQCREGTPLSIGIRPEAIRLSESNGMPAAIVQCRFAGARFRVSALIAEQPLVFYCDSEISGLRQIEIDSAEAVLFDETGNRV